MWMPMVRVSSLKTKWNQHGDASWNSQITSAAWIPSESEEQQHIHHHELDTVQKIPYISCQGSNAHQICESGGPICLAVRETIWPRVWPPPFLYRLCQTFDFSQNYRLWVTVSVQLTNSGHTIVTYKTNLCVSSFLDHLKSNHCATFITKATQPWASSQGLQWTIHSPTTHRHLVWLVIAITFSKTFLTLPFSTPLGPYALVSFVTKHSFPQKKAISSYLFHE